MKKPANSRRNEISHNETPKDLVFPVSFNTEFSTLKKLNQRRVFALGLVAVKRERDRLYEELPTGKKEALHMSAVDKNLHFQQFLPDVSEVTRKHTFSCKFLADYTGLKVDSLYSSFKKGCIAVTNKSIVIEQKEGREKTILAVTPIYEASFSTIHGCTIRIAESAVLFMMDHAKGFSEVDFKLWAELSSTHATRLLQVVSGFKGGFAQDWKIETVRTQLGVGKCYWTSDDEIKKASSKKYNLEMARIGAPKELMDGSIEMLYPKVADLRKDVIEPAFSQLIDKSDGVWTATDKDGKGFEFKKTHRAYTHLKFCLRYTDPKTLKLLRDSYQYSSQEAESAQVIDFMVSNRINLLRVDGYNVLDYVAARMRCGNNGHIMSVEVEGYFHAMCKNGMMKGYLDAARGDPQYAALANVRVPDVVKMLSEEGRNQNWELDR